MRAQPTVIASLICGALLVMATTQAANRRDAGGDSQQRALQQLMQQNAALEQEKASLTGERDSLRADIDKLRAEQAETRKQAEEQRAVLVTRLNGLQDEHGTLKERQRDTQSRLRAAERENTVRQRRIEALTRQGETCAADNHHLYELNVELLDRYRNKGVFDALMQKEPVTGLKDVEVGNIAQRYRDEFDKHQVAPHAAGE